MKLSDILSIIERTAQYNKLSKPYIVGGLVRDKYLGNIDKINDIDITTGSKDVFDLAQLVAKNLDTTLQVMPDGHSKIQFKNIKIDFSSAFKIPQIDRILKKGGIKNPTEMKKELYSRDFTCNTLLMTLDLSKILDPTGLAIEDINNNIIKTCLPPSITLSYDPKRIVRAIYLSAKLDFEIDNKVKEWIVNHTSIAEEIPDKYFKKVIDKGKEFNPFKVNMLLDELNLREVYGR